jgi:hypothetical protein
MRAMLILILAVTFGLAGGYAWSAMTAPAAREPAPRKEGFVPLPASPEERPAALDKAWESRAGEGPRPATGPAADAAPDPPVHYAGCNAVRAAGKAPLYAGQPGYSETMDGDHDGIACEPIRGT